MNFIEKHVGSVLVLVGWLALLAYWWGSSVHAANDHEKRITTLEQRLDTQQATINKISIDMEVVKSKLEFIVNNIKNGGVK